ncbi:MAG: metallophosphoesterase [Spirochaetes bacterium]|nr:metallophosphoesterase [Spirochaetota bacterium]
MKILLISDVISPVIYSSNLRDDPRFKNIDLVIGTGDLPFDYYDFIASNLNVPLLHVFGNHVLMEDEKKPSFINLDNRVKITHRTIIAGFEGSKRYNRGRHQYSEAEMKFKILKMIPRLIWNRIIHGRYLDILVTHAPPYGFGIPTDPAHQGFKIFLKFIERFKPKYVIHGHIHIYDSNRYRINEYKGAKIINAYNYRILEI